MRSRLRRARSSISDARSPASFFRRREAKAERCPSPPFLQPPSGSAMRRHLAVVIFVLTLAAAIVPAQAIAIKEVKTAGGITAWLVEDHTNPLIAMRFSFKGGSANDPPGKEGTAHFIAAMLDEGAGDLDSNAFQTQREELAM